MPFWPWQGEEQRGGSLKTPRETAGTVSVTQEGTDKLNCFRMPNMRCEQTELLDSETPTHPSGQCPLVYFYPVTCHHLHLDMNLFRQTMKEHIDRMSVYQEKLS